MNGYWLISLLFGAYLFGLGSGWKVESWRWDASLAKSAEHALSEVKTQENISTEATNDNAKNILAIDHAYDGDSVQPTDDGVPPLPNTSSATRPVQRTRSKVYGLTFQQCDLEEAKANTMWNWTQAQAKVH